MRIVLISVVSIFLLNSCKVFQEENSRVLLVTGGHEFDTEEFFEFFMKLENYDVDTLSQPQANKFIASKEGQSYDAYIFYDMWNEINEQEKEAYLDLTEAGKGLLFLHHSLVSYQTWDEFINIIGGKYIERGTTLDESLRSKFKDDLDLDIEILDSEHPVTKDIDNFSIHDEGYSNLKLTHQIKPLLGTINPDCHPIVGWTNSYQNSDIVYLIFGHDKKAYANANYQKLIYNSLEWLVE